MGNKVCSLVALFLLFSSLVATAQTEKKPEKKRVVYMSYILHGNMNYDRYVRTTLWRDFPIIYDNLLTFMDEHPDFKGQLQFSGQTLGSLLQAAPQVVEHAMKIHKRGQLNFYGNILLRACECQYGWRDQLPLRTARNAHRRGFAWRKDGRILPPRARLSSAAAVDFEQCECVVDSRNYQ